MKIKIKSKRIRSRFLYGDLLENNKTNTLVVFLSGFSGSGGMPLFKNASMYFYKKGFSTLRFNFCNDNESISRKDAVKPGEMKLAIYPAELKTIFDTLGKKYLKIILVGHSFGAVVSVLFLAKYKKYRKNIELILWEPSLLPWKREWMEEDFYFDKEKILYRSRYSKEIMNKAFYNECINIKSTAVTFRSLGMKAFIAATTKIGRKNAREYFSKLSNKKGSELVFIDKAGHSFEEKKHQKELFDETAKWIFG